MSEFVTDTHALYWHLTGDSRLSATARNVYADADLGIHRILVPSICLVEMIYLAERSRLDPMIVNQALTDIGVSGDNFLVSSLTRDTALFVGRVPRAAIPDMPDRIITATALQHGLPLISRDERIQRAAIVPVIW